jgi:phosphohistidine phosphatase SixA
VIALHLLRHAHAGDAMRWTGDDDVRPLSEKGIRQSERLGRLLAGFDEAPDLFITSPRLRASQTADIVARALDARVVVDERLARALDLDVIEAVLGGDAARSDRPCLVGHDPDFSELLGDLLGMAPIPMRKGAIARVDVPDRHLVAGDGILRYLLPPELLPGKHSNV